MTISSITVRFMRLLTQITALIFLTVFPCFAQQLSFSRFDYPAADTPYAVAVGDFNHDGRLDIAVANQSCTGGCAPRGTISVFLANGIGSFDLPINYLSGGGRTAEITAEDVNNDGNLDLLIANYNNANVSVLLGNYDGTFRPQLTSDTFATYAINVTPVKLTSSGLVDLAATSGYDGFSINLGNGDGTFQFFTGYGALGPVEGIAAGDFNRDGKQDIAVANEGTASPYHKTTTVYLGNGDGTLQPGVPLLTGVRPTGVIAVDLNHDGKLDLVVANLGDEITVALGNGDGTFGTANRIPDTYATYKVDAGDIDGDGNVDLVGSFPGATSIVLGNGDGSFRTPYLIPNSGIFRPVIADLNNDGRPDIVGGDGQVMFVLLNTTQPPYSATIQPPIKPDGSSAFKHGRGVVPVKFTLSLRGASTCSLPNVATISLLLINGSTSQPVNPDTFETPADLGTQFRVGDCQYVYNLGTQSLQQGTYLVEISINGIAVGSARFGIQ